MGFSVKKSSDFYFQSINLGMFIFYFGDNPNPVKSSHPRVPLFPRFEFFIFVSPMSLLSTVKSDKHIAKM